MRLQVPESSLVRFMEISTAGSSINAGEYRIEDAEKLGKLLEGMRQANAKPDGIEDLEPSGQQYNLTIHEEQVSSTYVIDDLRSSDATVWSVKISKENENGTMDAWVVPSAWLSLILDEPVVPSLWLFTNNESASVTVLANRELKRDTAEQSVADSLRLVLPENARAPAYDIYWSDPGRFVVRFSEKPSAPLLLRFDKLLSVSGESFVDPDRADSAEAVLGDRGGQRIRWINPAKQSETVQMFKDTALLQPIHEGSYQADKLMAYHFDGTQTIIERDGGKQRRLGITKWPDAEGSYPNDYGADVLYSDRMLNGETYAVYGNRTLYRVHLNTGEIKKLYTSPAPVYGMASSPDGERVALLISSHSLGPDADLIVFSKDGRKLFSRANAGYINKSDGFLFVAPMTWPDNSTVVVPRSSEAGSRVRIHIGSKEETPYPSSKLPDSAAALLAETLSGQHTVSHIVPQQDAQGVFGRYIMFKTGNGWVWIYDLNKHALSWYGTGIPISWTKEGEAVVWTSDHEHTTFYIGMDTD
ncbi:hypothetical protein [Paenibacillus pinihumi]|uniref:hypothetical protein n=1 Tax=Paenibacillus pinihumi TaxID=669462 RepID=UPI0004921889|nr:hypothetical protein [Paenibacillus pinihumi]